MDVKNVFLHRNFKEDIFVKLLFDMTTTLPLDVCKLKHSSNVLKQAPQAWIEKFYNTLLNLSFLQILPIETLNIDLEEIPPTPVAAVLLLTMLVRQSSMGLAWCHNGREKELLNW
ncbi:hypothetical protein CR513_52658, partial [Mucuna pruriens]